MARNEVDVPVGYRTPGVALQADPPGDGNGTGSGVRCSRPGCTGELEDGFCNLCGLAPVEDGQPGAHAGGHAEQANPVSPGVEGEPLPQPSRGSARRSEQPRRSGSRRTGPVGTRSGRTRRGNLGMGLVEVPPVPSRDPRTAILANPEVAEANRFCGSCQGPVGRTQRGKPGRLEGFCPRCGQRYSFSPKLRAGDVVGGQYEVIGCIAHGGLGWLYLAKDRNVSDRWVVLKGLLDSADPDAMEAAISERRFLAEIEHPNIVKIYNFVQTEDAGYTVMEYVSGMSLRSVRRQHMENTGEPMSVATDIAFMMEILPALGYLHGKNLLYCDFKPENIIQTEEQVKLIDLGAVRHMDDDASPLYGTVGFQAPEVAELGPSIASDLYMVARTLAVLALDVRGLLDENLYASRLPPVAQVPVFSRYESFYRFLARGSHPDPDVRFPSAEVMEEQLLGVLREVAALDGGPAHPFPSRLFSPEQIANPDEADWRSLPAPYVDDGDAPAGRDMKTRSTPPQAERAPTSLEMGLRLAQDCIQAGELDRADQTLQALVNEGSVDWRIAWWSGIRALAGGLHQLAAEDFDAVYSELPGELAPKLALACALEQRGDTRRASGYYAMVASTDPNCASASLGLARCRLALGDRAGAARALQAVPATSSAHARGQVMLCRVLSATVGGAAPALPDLVLASETVEQIQGDPQQRAQLICDLLASVLTMLHNGVLVPHPDVSIAGARLSERDVRRGLERACRELARYAPTREERVRLIDRANHYRPRSLL